MKSGIYRITNTVNGKCYIGSAVSLKKRLTNHKCHLRKGDHHNSKLQRAWDKYGELAFVFEVIEHVVDKSALISREQHHIDAHHSYGNKTGYNICPIAGSSLGVTRTEESRFRMSEAGKKRPPITEETRRKLSILSSNKKQTPESILKMVTKRKADGSFAMSEESKAKMIKSKIGKKASIETKQKMSEAHLNKSADEKQIIAKKMSSSMAARYAKRSPLQELIRGRRVGHTKRKMQAGV